MSELVTGETPHFPKYTTQIMNLANSNSQGTRPKVVGQMSELIQEFPGRLYEEWEQWYLNEHPDTLDQATDKIFSMIELIHDAVTQITKPMVKEWVKDLVITKTFIGLKFQEIILKKIALIKQTDYRLSTPEEESQGIDGYIGGTAVSIKPVTYKIKSNLPEQINAPIIFYEKTKHHLIVAYDF